MSPGGKPFRCGTFPGDHIRASLEKSLRASGLEAFDLLQFHVWSDEWMGRGDWLETIEDLKREGKIRFFGVGQQAIVAKHRWERNFYAS